MEMSSKDRLIIVAICATGTMLYLLIAYDPLNILDTTQKMIIAAMVTIALFPLSLYQRQKTVKKWKKTT